MKAKINFDGNWLSDKVFDSYRFTFKDRLKRSLKTFFIFLGAALFSVLIPVLHFFLVPVFLILSVFLSYRKFNEILSINLQNLNCPGCETKLSASETTLKRNDSIIRLSCESCRKGLTIVFKEDLNEVS